jgi:hypothetical protein
MTWPLSMLRSAGRRSLAVLGLTLASGARCQFQSQSPAELVEFLTKSSSPGESQPGVGSCGIDQQEAFERGAAKALVDRGAASAQAVEKALDSFEEGAHLRNAKRLMYAYATILGPAAFPRLSRLASDPRLDNSAIAVDDSIAISLGLTSYVSSSGPARPVFRCRGPELHDALDQFISGWERDDRARLEASLGPEARAAMSSLLAAGGWAQLRAVLWPTRSSGRGAVGYRFVVPHQWSLPEMASIEHADASTDAPVLVTRFTTRTGEECGSLRISFLKVLGPTATEYTEAYLVNDPNLAGLLRLIGSCAAQ